VRRIAILAIASFAAATPLRAAQPNAARLAVSVVGGGKIVSTPRAISCPPTCRHTFYRGAIVRLTPRPFAGWRFAHWTGACRGSGACLLTLRRATTSVGVVFAAIPPPPPPPPPPQVEIIDFWVCPGTDTHPTLADARTGQVGRACNRDWGGSAFAAGNDLVCSAEEHNGSGQTIVMTLVRDGAVVLTTPDGYRLDSPLWYSWLYYTWNPSIPTGSYACQIKLDGSVVAERSFAVAS
jgi:hypothetical protein